MDISDGVHLYIPELLKLNFEKAEKIIENICRYEDEWNFEYALGKASGTGYGYGNLEFACASDKRKRIVGGIGMYQTMGKGSTGNPFVMSDFDAGVKKFYPSFSFVAKIESPELRKFIGLFYEGLYETSLEEKG